MSRNKYYTTGNLLGLTYFKENYRLTAIDLGKQTKLKDMLQINFSGRLESQDQGATMLFIIKKSEETTLDFCEILYTSYKNESKDCELIKKF